MIEIVIGTLRTIPKSLVKVLEDLEIRDHLNYAIIKIGQNSEKSPETWGDLHSLKLQWCEKLSRYN